MYTKISPLGPREGFGTFDTLYDNRKYDTLDKATSANDYVILDFVKDDQDVISFEIYHVQHPENKKYHRLNFQRFPAGIDILDDQLGCEMATTLFLEP